MKFILNKTSRINQIENILLEKILKTFSFPENIEINIEKDNILDICLEYPDIDLNIYYVINLKSPQNHTIHFIVKKLYLTDSNFIEEDELIGFDSKDYDTLKDALEKLSLNDAALEYEPETYRVTRTTECHSGRICRRQSDHRPTDRPCPARQRIAQRGSAEPLHPPKCRSDSVIRKK